VQFLSDLNSEAIVLTVLSVVINLLVLGYTWSNFRDGSPITISRVYGLPLGLAAVCIFLAYEAYCPDADQPHVHLTGQVVRQQSYTYSSGKSTYIGTLVCMDSCTQDRPLLEFRSVVRKQLAQIEALPQVTVVYLGRTERADVVDGGKVTAHPVVEVDDAAGGTQFFYEDTTRHWPRVWVLMGDIALGCGTFALCLLMANKKRDSGDSGGVGVQASRMPEERTSGS